MPQKKTRCPSSSQKKYPGITTTPQHALAWGVTGRHVYPFNDLREHCLGDCWCRPVDDEGLIVHNSLDGRELYEDGSRKPS